MVDGLTIRLNKVRLSYVSCAGEMLENTVGPCTLAQSDHLWGLAVTKPMILSTKGINMTWCRYIGLQHIQKSAF